MSKNLESSYAEERDLFPVNLAANNQLLTRLMASAEVRDALLPYLRTISLERNQVLYEQGDKIELIYFPITSVVSTLAIMEDGTTMETSMIGRDGLVGLPAILGSGTSKHWFWTSISGPALQIETRFLERIFVRHEHALKALLSFYRSMITQVSQRCVCNTRHSILERLSCWLLMIHDRVDNADLRLTQEMIASRLGARRAGITVAAGVLQAMHAIEYRRGQIHIADRELLERTVCECYTIIRHDRQFHPPQPSHLPVSRYK